MTIKDAWEFSIEAVCSSSNSDEFEARANDDDYVCLLSAVSL